MQKNAALMSICLFMSGVSIAHAATGMHHDVDVFIENAKNCEHFAGEWDSSLTKSEQRIIERSISKYCGAAQKQLKSLKAKYKSDADMQRILADHANDSVLSFVR